MNDKTSLRMTLRQTRQALSPHVRQMAAKHITTRVLNTDVFKKSTHIGVYWAIPEEIDPNMLVTTALQLGKRLYLPVLSPNCNLLGFADYAADTPLTPNRFGILEPKHPVFSIEPQDLDLVFVPLVGFDLQGNRLGMGQGYYDMTFKKQGQKTPFLLGLAFECQKTKAIPVDQNDVRLSAIATEHALYAF